MTRLTLEQILSSEDHDGLLDVKPAASAAGSDASRIAHDFEELNRFVDQHGYVPGEGPGDRKPSVKERVLSMRLKSYGDRRQIAAQLKTYDRHGLLAGETTAPHEPASVDEILDLDDELLNTDRKSVV